MLCEVFAGADRRRMQQSGDADKVLNGMLSIYLDASFFRKDAELRPRSSDHRLREEFGQVSRLAKFDAGRDRGARRRRLATGD